MKAITIRKADWKAEKIMTTLQEEELNPPHCKHTCMGASIDDIEGRDWHEHILIACKICNVSVQWHSLVVRSCTSSRQ